MRTVLWPSALVAALALTACGSVPEEFKEAEALECPSGSDCYDPPRPEGPGGQLEVEAGEFYFEIRGGEAQEGAVEVTLDNVGGADHSITVPDLDFEAVAQSGESIENSFVAPTTPGSLDFFCKFHPDEMTGTISIGGVDQPIEEDVDTPAEDDPDVEVEVEENTEEDTTTQEY